MKTEGKDESKTETVSEKAMATEECLYLQCLGRDRLIAAADKGLLFPLYSAI